MTEAAAPVPVISLEGEPLVPQDGQPISAEDLVASLQDIAARLLDDAGHAAGAVASGAVTTARVAGTTAVVARDTTVTVAQALLVAAEKVSYAAEVTRPYAVAVAKPLAEGVKYLSVIALARAAALVRDDNAAHAAASRLAMYTLGRVGGGVVVKMAGTRLGPAARQASDASRGARLVAANTIDFVADELAARSVPEHLENLNSVTQSHVVEPVVSGWHNGVVAPVSAAHGAVRSGVSVGWEHGVVRPAGAVVGGVTVATEAVCSTWNDSIAGPAVAASQAVRTGVVAGWEHGVVRPTQAVVDAGTTVRRSVNDHVLPPVQAVTERVVDPARTIIGKVPEVWDASISGTQAAWRQAPQAVETTVQSLQSNVVEPVRGAVACIPGAWQNGVVEPTQQVVGQTQQFWQAGVVQPAASVVEKVPAAYDSSVQAVVQGWNTVTDNVWVPVATAAVTWWSKPGAEPLPAADPAGFSEQSAASGIAPLDLSDATTATSVGAAATSAAVAAGVAAAVAGNPAQPGAEAAVGDLASGAGAPEAPAVSPGDSSAQPAASDTSAAATAQLEASEGPAGAVAQPPDHAGTSQSLANPTVPPLLDEAGGAEADGDAGFHDCEEDVNPADAGLPTEESMEATLAALEANMIQAGAPHGAIKETVANVRSAMKAALAAKRAA
mmetsp:Transcript_83362/g.222974  ORF Transcript_83362/g.222974 Transcript_83362/m.222974 type:complete len:668 (+) Transcript_83362:18-2021(+)